MYNFCMSGPEGENGGQYTRLQGCLESQMKPFLSMHAHHLLRSHLVLLRLRLSPGKGACERVRARALFIFLTNSYCTFNKVPALRPEADARLGAVAVKRILCRVSSWRLLVRPPPQPADDQ